jgi:hypothetical protein
MAIIKDFYEAYCIYTFLSFMIAVLGRGDRDEAVEVLSKHASHLQRPARCLSCFYDPSPGVSDTAMANAVITQCQIYCLQFTFLRPITTVIYVLMNNDDNKQQGTKSGTNSETNTYTSSNVTSTGSDEDMVTTDNGLSQQVDDTVSENDNDIIEDTDKEHPHDTDANFGPNHNRTRWLDEDHRNQTRPDLDDKNEESGEPGNVNEDEGYTPANSPEVQNIDYQQDERTWRPTPAPVQDMFGTLSPLIISNAIPTLVPTMAVLVPTIAVPASDGNGTIPTSMIDDIVYDTPTSSEEETTSAILQSTEAYLKSSGFALAMVVNISVFFAFSGLLKF